MNQDSANNFNPPSAEKVRSYLDRYRPTGPMRWPAMLPMVALGVIVGLTFMSDPMFAVLLPVLVLTALFGALTWRVRNLRELERRAALAGELTLTRQYPRAMRLAWRLLPSLRTMPELHGRTVSVMAYCLHQVKAHEAAITAYDYLIDHLPPGHPGSVQFTIERTISQLMSDRLADADDALRRLRGRIGAFAQGPIGASYCLAELLQQVQTNHFADAVEGEGDLVDRLRPLGVDAAFGYALMALSHQKLLDHGGDASIHVQKADQWWGRATLLLPMSALIGRYRQLRDLHARTPCRVPQEMRAS